MISQALKERNIGWASQDEKLLQLKQRQLVHAATSYAQLSPQPTASGLRFPAGANSDAIASRRLFLRAFQSPLTRRLLPPNQRSLAVILRVNFIQSPQPAEGPSPFR